MRLLLPGLQKDATRVSCMRCLSNATALLIMWLDLGCIAELAEALGLNVLPYSSQVLAFITACLASRK